MMFWFVVFVAIVFLFVCKDDRLKLSVANVLVGAIDSSVGMSNDDETGVAAKAKIHKPTREYISPYMKK